MLSYQLQVYQFHLIKGIQSTRDKKAWLSGPSGQIWKTESELQKSKKKWAQVQSPKRKTSTAHWDDKLVCFSDSRLDTKDMHPDTLMAIIPHCWVPELGLEQFLFLVTIFYPWFTYIRKLYKRKDKNTSKQVFSFATSVWGHSQILTVP